MTACKCRPAAWLFDLGAQGGLRRIDVGDGGVDRVRRHAESLAVADAVGGRGQRLQDLGRAPQHLLRVLEVVGRFRLGHAWLLSLGGVSPPGLWPLFVAFSSGS